VTGRWADAPATPEDVIDPRWNDVMVRATRPWRRGRVDTGQALTQLQELVGSL
jgi:hypothetical protein